ncbi:TonB family protein [Tritonibacter scottomollicae]|uniref:TonB family protein n=1 Tax=Tritonibacter scottomollicae TaxID=483013 RepID=A0ABZ0HE56_TRISK|nr:TonB family protein [Tritonibacter scottomollicae]WOI33130.1 TonB family protein [Tritonibacter scottomollicae]
MIPRSPLIASLSVCVALAAHAAFLVDMGAASVEIEGGGSVAPAALGSSFADLAQGRASPVEAETLPDTQQVTEPVPPTQTTSQPTAAPTSPAQDVTAVTPVPEAVAPVEQPALSAAASTSVSPTDAVSVVASVPVAKVAAVPQSDLAPDSGPRPPERPTPPPVEATKQPEKPVVKPATAAPRGNSATNARAGTESGAEDQRAARASSARAGKSTDAGNAAASNYPGQVMRKISRQRKPRTSARGVAHIAFAIGAGGQLTTVRVAKSSGSAELDQLAVQQIRRAGPFPPPPAGARTRFTIAIKGR